MQEIQSLNERIQQLEQELAELRASIPTKEDVLRFVRENERDRALKLSGLDKL